MANTPTTNLGLLKPAAGDFDWHDEINGNLDAIDAAIFALQSGGGGGGSGAPVRENFTATAVQTTFTCVATLVSGQELVFLNGLLLRLTDDYTISGLHDIVMPARLVGDKVTVLIYGAPSPLGSTYGWLKLSTADRLLLTPSEGAGVYDTDLHQLMVWNGTEWGIAG